MRICDLVEADVQADFRSDVKLSDYDDPELNSSLLEHYIFTVHAPSTTGMQQRTLSAWEVVSRLKDLFVTSRAENRMVLVANYGHGKSHLALVLANFFAKDVLSDEVGIILDKLSHALNDPSRFQGLREFKQSKGTFLVVRLRGDAFSDLRAGFTAALEQALREHEATRGVQMPFWQAKAWEWLQSLNGDQRARAEAFLAERRTSLDLLARSLGDLDSYATVRELFKHLNGAYPDFGREVSLEEMVKWAVNQVCAPNRFGGLLVLFDEFGLFLQKYAATSVPGALQELLNGISDCRGRAAFVAFSQYDVDVVAETYAEGARQQDVKKELERLPLDARYRLYSALESVLAAYLKQNQTAWEHFERQSPRIKGSLSAAREAVLRCFSRRYEEFKWRPEMVLDRLVKGCFPLHPLTAAILATHAFEAGPAESPRTALQFVRRAWEDVCSQPAFTEAGVPRFVHPVALVDFFSDQVSKEWYPAYRRAAEAVEQGSDEEQVLKALLLQHAVRELKAAGRDQVELLAHLSGLAEDKIKGALRALAQREVIRREPREQCYELWPEAARSRETLAIVEQAESSVAVDKSLMEYILAKIPKPALELNSLKFGHADDWQPRVVVLTTDMFTVGALEEHLLPSEVEQGVLREVVRGLLVLVIAEDEQRRSDFLQNAQAVLAQTLRERNVPKVPIVVLLPRRATPQLIQAARRAYALEEEISTEDRRKLGELLYENLKQDAELRLKGATEAWLDGLDNVAHVAREPQDFLVPQDYVPFVQAMRRPSLKAVFAECYKRAYADRPEFFTQYPVSGKGPNKLRDATHKVAYSLLANSASVHLQGRSRDIEFQIGKDYLKEKWGLFDAENRIQPPTYRAVRAAWEALERIFPEGCKEVRADRAIFELLAPPYGHDFNTLTLVFAAWIGYHKDSLRLYIGGKLFALADFQKWFEDAKHPQGFLTRCINGPLALSRTKQSEALSQLKERLAKPSLTVTEARELLIGAEQLALPESERKAIAERCEQIERALQAAEDYDTKAASLLKTFSEAELEDVVKAREQIKDLPQCTKVIPDQPSVSELEAKWQQTVRSRLPQFCAQHAALKDIGEYSAQERKLKAVRTKLSQFPELVPQIDAALQTLAQARDELQKREREREIVAKIRQMSSTDILSKLYAYRDELRAYANLSAQTTQLRDQKLSEVEAEIQRIEREADILQQALEHILDPGALKQAQRQLTQLLPRVEGTPYCDQLLAVQTKHEHLDGFMRALEQLNGRQPNTPEALRTLEQEVHRLGAESPAWLGAAQRELLAQAQQRLEQIRKAKAQEAARWLESIESQVNGAADGTALNEAWRKLESPPAFLPADQHERLARLKQDVQQRLGADLIKQIEALFAQIADKDLRRECIARLQALVEVA